MKTKANYWKPPFRAANYIYGVYCILNADAHMVMIGGGREACEKEAKRLNRKYGKKKR